MLFNDHQSWLSRSFECRAVGLLSGFNSRVSRRGPTEENSHGGSQHARCWSVRIIRNLINVERYRGAKSWFYVQLFKDFIGYSNQNAFSLSGVSTVPQVTLAYVLIIFVMGPCNLFLSKEKVFFVDRQNHPFESSTFLQYSCLVDDFLTSVTRWSKLTLRKVFKECLHEENLLKLIKYLCV